MTARDLLAAATPRPWHHAADSLYGAPKPPPLTEPFDEDAWMEWFDNADRIAWGDVEEHDAALIVAAVNEYEALLNLAEVGGAILFDPEGTISPENIDALNAALDALDAIRSGT